MQNTNKNITIRSQLEHLCQYKYIDFENFAQFSSNIMRIQNSVFCIRPPLKQKYGFILVKLGNLFHMKAKHVRYDNLSVHLGAEP